MAVNNLVAMFRLIKLGNLVDLPRVRGIAFHKVLLLYSVFFSHNLVVERGNVDLVHSSHKEKFPYCQSHFYPYRLVALVGIVGVFP
ncbi:MAG: hypothetical protein BRC52_14300 [Cyanobacteria bacterium SW_5_48_44]|nr:MAG: hypothetical protein BRC52_14300 [Cyanobacteria bacterium SW_5_48_44]